MEEESVSPCCELERERSKVLALLLHRKKKRETDMGEWGMIASSTLEVAHLHEEVVRCNCVHCFCSKIIAPYTSRPPSQEKTKTEIVQEEKKRKKGARNTSFFFTLKGGVRGTATIIHRTHRNRG